MKNMMNVYQKSVYRKKNLNRKIVISDWKLKVCLVFSLFKQPLKKL